MDAANSINSIFHSIFTEQCEFPEISFPPEIDDVTVNDAEEFLSRIKTSKSSMNDGIPPILYKASSLVLAKPLSQIVSFRLKKAAFPANGRKQK